MHFLFILTLAGSLLTAAASHSAPAPNPPEESASVLPELKLLDRIGEVGSQVEASASQLVTDALGFLGVPYRRGGNSAETGFDCSGLVRTLYEQTTGLLLPRKASDQAAATEKIDKKELQPGDLVFFNTMRRAFSHVGIYIGNGKFVHAPKPGGEVRVEDLGAPYWTKRFDGARRVPTGNDNGPQK
ncbi:MAG: C40 family peptidase [Rhodoferax sp.]|nr:C40 family peptidase [Rhodoferax sp.]